MPLDPQLAPLLDQVNALPPMSSGTPVEARERFRRMALASASLSPPVEVGRVEEVDIEGAAGPRRARVYRPERAGPAPTLLFLHGGGFVIGDIESYDGQCRTLCRGADAVVVAVDYRLAPEDPFPAAVEDAVASAGWTLDHATDLGGDPARVAIGGDSAGGNLAAVATQALRGRDPGIAAQLLIYPVTDFSQDRPSVEENGDGLFLTRDDMRWFESHYLGEGGPSDDPRVSPLLAEDLAGLPPAVVVTAELDPLRDDGEAYAEALEAAGIPVVKRRYDALVHGFFAMGTFSGTARDAVEEVCADLRTLLG